MNFCEQAFNKIINHIRETTHPPPQKKIITVTVLFVKNSIRTCTFNNKCNIFYDKPTLNNNFNVNDGLNIYMYFIDLSLRCKFYGCPKLLGMTLYLHLSHTNVRYFSGRQKKKNIMSCSLLAFHCMLDI